MTAALALSSVEVPSLSSAEVPRPLARLVVVDRARPAIRVTDFAALPQWLRAGDLVVVNDAATLPALLHGHTADGAAFELRLAGPIDGVRLTGVLLGAGDYHTRTEHRPPPPALRRGEHVTVGGIIAEVASADGRLVALDAERDGDALWQALYAHGAPVQYAHRPELLPLWSVQTAYAARPWAAEMPSAGRSLTWEVLLGLRRAGVSLARLTHAAGLSSTGDAALDRALPWPERYEVPERTARELVAAKARGGRVIAIGTTVVRALEASGGSPGPGVATLRLGPESTLGVVDGIVSGLHAPGESHFELLRAFAPRNRLLVALDVAAAHHLSAHELGDACLVL